MIIHLIPCIISGRYNGEYDFVLKQNVPPSRVSLNYPAGLVLSTIELPTFILSLLGMEVRIMGGTDSLDVLRERNETTGLFSESSKYVCKRACID